MGAPRRWSLITALLLLAACGPGDRGAAGDSVPDPTRDDAVVVVVDHRGDTVALPGPATRVVSLVPSVTWTLLRMGAGDALVARTDYDTLAAVAELPSVGGGLGPNLEVLRILDPQVVVSFAGESDLRTSEGLRALGIPEVAVRPDRLEDVPPIVRLLGRLTGREEEASTLIAALERDLEAVRRAVSAYPPVQVAYLLGGSPPLIAGPDTFISDLVELAGGRNVLDDLDGQYAPVSPEVLRIREIDVLLLGEGSTVDSRITRGRRVEEIPSWVEVPGPALGEAAWIVARAIHPSLSEGGA